MEKNAHTICKNIILKNQAGSNTQLKGQLAEEAAYQYLLQKGLQLVTRNYRCKMGEIDLILKDSHEFIFVEVRYRNRSCFGTAVDSITLNKQRKLIKTAAYYIQHHYILLPCRFDVVSIMPNKDKKCIISWIPNAFQV